MDEVKLLLYIKKSNGINPTINTAGLAHASQFNVTTTADKLIISTYICTRLVCKSTAYATLYALNYRYNQSIMISWKKVNEITA